MTDMTPDLMNTMGAAAKAASRELAVVPAEAKTQALHAAADAVWANREQIIEANAKDLEFGRNKGLTDAMMDRLMLDESRIRGIVDGLRNVADQEDPIGAVTEEWTQPSGLNIRRVRTPIGVIGVIYESRPNVTADAGALCLKSGNAVILRGGSESFHSSSAIHACMVEGLKAAGLPPASVQLVPTRDRAAVKDMLQATDYIDVIVDEQGLTKNRIMMLDILNNFDWKRPIYFTGGANSDEEYIWMKDYLQLDGMAFKLVPIKTDNKDKTMFDMGRIDADKMYNNVKKWDWKTINNGEIYLDEQSKRNAISMRNNLMRLSETYVQQGDSVNAKDVLDLSLYKMPIEDFGHYSISLGYPELYYRIGDNDKARETTATLINIFQQHLKHYSTYSDDDIYLIADELDTKFYMYRNIINQATEYDTDKEYVENLQDDFIEYLKLFGHLMGDMPEEMEPEEINMPLDSVIP